LDEAAKATRRRHRCTEKRCEARVCPMCGREFEVVVGSRNWGARRFCGNACRCKWYRVKGAMLEEMGADPNG
jgi:hypothetical protein